MNQITDARPQPKLPRRPYPWRVILTLVTCLLISASVGLIYAKLAGIKVPSEDAGTDFVLTTVLGTALSVIATLFLGGMWHEDGIDKWQYKVREIERGNRY